MEYARSLALLRPGERLLLLLSGGADSMAMLELMARCDVRLRLGMQLAALHVNYGLRGADSERDRRIVEEAQGIVDEALKAGQAPGGSAMGEGQRAGPRGGS